MSVPMSTPMRASQCARNVEVGRGQFEPIKVKRRRNGAADEGEGLGIGAVARGGLPLVFGHENLRRLAAQQVWAKGMIAGRAVNRFSDGKR